MDVVGALLNSSPTDVAEILSGILTGAIVLSALVLSAALRRMLLIAAALFLLYLIVTQGPTGIETLADHLLASARRHEQFVRGVIVGKILVGTLWQFRRSGQIAD